jgi:hypothetical protein
MLYAGGFLSFILRSQGVTFKTVSLNDLRDNELMNNNFLCLHPVPWSRWLQWSFPLLLLQSLVLLCAVGVHASVCTKLKSGTTDEKFSLRPGSTRVSGQVQHESLSVFIFHMLSHRSTLLNMVNCNSCFCHQGVLISCRRCSAESWSVAYFWNSFSVHDHRSSQSVFLFHLRSVSVMRNSYQERHYESSNFRFSFVESVLWMLYTALLEKHQRWLSTLIQAKFVFYQKLKLCISETFSLIVL